MAKEIFRIEDSDNRFEVHRCLYPKPTLFIFATNKLTGKTRTSEQTMTAPWSPKFPIAGTFPVMQTAMTEAVQTQSVISEAIKTETDVTTELVWQHLLKLTKESAKSSQAPNPKKPESKKPASKIPKSDPFERAGKKRSTQRWE